MTWNDNIAETEDAWAVVWGFDNENPTFPEGGLIRRYEDGYGWEIWCFRSSNMIAHGTAPTLEAAKLEVEAAITPTEFLNSTRDDDVRSYRCGL